MPKTFRLRPNAALAAAIRRQSPSYCAFMLMLLVDADWYALVRFVTIWGFRKLILGGPIWSPVKAYGDGAARDTAKLKTPLFFLRRATVDWARAEKSARRTRARTPPCDPARAWSGRNS